MSLSRGRLEISFRSVEELAEAMLVLARVLEAEGEEFAELFETKTYEKESAEATETTEIFSDLLRMEERRLKQRSDDAHSGQ